MAEPWITVAPLRNLWRLPDGLTLPFWLDDRTSLQRLPSWLGKSNEVDVLSPKFAEAIENSQAQYCVAMEYKADALESIQQVAAEKVLDVVLALWLVRPTSVHIEDVAHIVRPGRDAILRQLATYDPLRPLPDYVDDAYTEDELVKARQIFQGIGRLSQTGTLRTTKQAVARALTENHWTMRFLVFWLAVESLFGPEDAREITHRLSQRVALFLSPDRSTARKFFVDLKKNYAWRSKVVHGLRLAKLTSEQSRDLMLMLEDVARKSFVAILSDTSLLATFDGKDREGFLDELVFK